MHVFLVVHYNKQLLHVGICSSPVLYYFITVSQSPLSMSFPLFVILSRVLIW